MNNVETLAHVPRILRDGADWFRSMGTAESPGTTVATVVGDVAAPVRRRDRAGHPARGTSSRDAGGLRDGPPGAGRVLRRRQRRHHRRPPRRAGRPTRGWPRPAAGSGSAGFIVYDDSACMVEVARELSRFLYVESCGQCRSCKFGSGEITRTLDVIAAGDGTDRDVEVIGARLLSVTDQTRCYLAAEEQILISSILRAFPEEFALHLEGRCSVEPRDDPRAQAGRGRRRRGHLRRAPRRQAARLDLRLTR